MKRLFASLLMFSVLLCSCSQEEDILPAQQKKLTSYLTSTHSPKLVPEDQVQEDEVLAFYSTAGNSVYRYIDVDDYYNPDRANRKEVTASSRVTITFRAYVFDYKNIITTGTTVTMPYFTNDPVLEQAFVNAGLSTEFWSFEPKAIDMNRPDIIKGLYLALLGCREGDTDVEAYMTYNMAYGEDNFSIIPRESPIAIIFTVNSVE